MTAFPNSPRLIRGGIVLVDPDSSAIVQIITLQYNPDSLSRSLQAQAVGLDSGDRSEVLRLKAPAVETIKVEAEIDATDQLELPDQNQNAVQLGIYPQLAALETGVPVSFGVLTTDTLQQAMSRVNKGAEAVRTALEMSDLFNQLRATARAPYPSSATRRRRCRRFAPFAGRSRASATAGATRWSPRSGASTRTSSASASCSTAARPAPTSVRAA